MFLKCPRTFLGHFFSPLRPPGGAAANFAAAPFDRLHGPQTVQRLSWDSFRTFLNHFWAARGHFLDIFLAARARSGHFSGIFGGRAEKRPRTVSGHFYGILGVSRNLGIQRDRALQTWHASDPPPARPAPRAPPPAPGPVCCDN